MSDANAVRQVLLKRVLALTCLAVAGAALTASPAAAGSSTPDLAGRLDPSFGSGGKVEVAAPEQAEAGRYPKGLGFALLAAPGGALGVGWGPTVYRVLANGRPDPKFGQGGRIALEAPDGIEFAPAGIAVDSRGRILVAGTSRSALAQPGPPYHPEPFPSWVTIARFLPNGARDRSFGSDGSLDTTFGQAPPAPQTSYGDHSLYTYTSPAVAAGAIAVDDEDRPLFAGTAVSEVEQCYSGNNAYPVRTFIARLTEEGQLDATSATTPVPTKGATELLASSGGFILQSGLGPHCGDHGNPGPPTQILRLTPQGTLEPGFEVSGAILQLFHEFHYEIGSVPPKLASNSHGQIVLAGSSEFANPAKSPNERQSGNLVAYLEPDGALDPSFGGDGYAAILGNRHFSIEAAALDNHGRPVLAGSTADERQRFQLMRMTAQGHPDRRFGVRGFRTTSFGTGTEGRAEAVLINGKGRILVGGWLADSRLPGGYGFALARYIGGR